MKHQEELRTIMDGDSCRLQGDAGGRENAVSSSSSGGAAAGHQYCQHTAPLASTWDYSGQLHVFTVLSNVTSTDRRATLHRIAVITILHPSHHR